MAIAMAIPEADSIEIPLEQASVSSTIVLTILGEMTNVEIEDLLYWIWSDCFPLEFDV